MDKRILDMVSSPADLKLLTNEELSILAQEVREEIITTASETGGHVASSLGAVEIILAVHSMMDCPHDKIVFDVGHQAYAHKLITGRLDEFRTLRTYGGLSGFPKPDESPYDVHPSGHASDSLSVALGLAKASRQPVAVIVTSGTATANLYPALIEAGLTGEKLILLTADRPPELIDCGANQAIRQPGMFASHPAQTISLPRPSQDIPARWLVSTIDQALGALPFFAVISCISSSYPGASTREEP